MARLYVDLNVTDENGDSVLAVDGGVRIGRERDTDMANLDEDRGGRRQPRLFNDGDPQDNDGRDSDGDGRDEDDTADDENTRADGDDGNGDGDGVNMNTDLLD